MIEYKGSSAVEFIILAMIKCWEAPLEEKIVDIPESKPKPEEIILPLSTADEEEKAKAAEEKNKAAAAKNAEASKEEPKIAKKCPIFDPACVGVGISNKLHPLHKNVI